MSLILTLLGLLDPEDEGTTVLQNVKNDFSSSTASHSRTELSEPKFHGTLSRLAVCCSICRKACVRMVTVQNSDLLLCTASSHQDFLACCRNMTHCCVQNQKSRGVFTGSLQARIPLLFPYMFHVFSAVM